MALFAAHTRQLARDRQIPVTPIEQGDRGGRTPPWATATTPPAVRTCATAVTGSRGRGDGVSTAAGTAAPVDTPRPSALSASTSVSSNLNGLTSKTHNMPIVC